MDTEQLFDRIVKYETEKDWTYTNSFNKLHFCCENFVIESKELEKIAKEKDYWYVDVSEDRDKVLKDTLEKIKELV